MINREKTKLKYGYFPEDLSDTSNKPVVWQCDREGCKNEHDYSYAYCLKKADKALHEGKSESCQKCSHSHRKGTSLPPQNKIKAHPLPPEVNLGKTMELFGINAEDLTPWSRQQVILDCKCGKESITKRCVLNLNKSVIETGHYKCVGCCTKSRRKGKKASAETKAKMKASQRKRRGHVDPIVFPEPMPSVAHTGTDGISPLKDGKLIPFPKK